MDNNMALGFRFCPTEEELISFYLCNKLQGMRPDLDRVIPVLNIYEMDPWHLPKFSESCVVETRGNGSSSWQDKHGKPVEEKRIELPVQGTGKLRHEYSLCRVYMGTGWLRAFDRRPSGAITREIAMEVHQANSRAGMTIGSGDMTTTSLAMEVHEVVSGARMTSGTGDREMATTSPAMEVHEVVSGAGITNGSGDMATTSHHQTNPPKTEKSVSQDRSSSSKEDAHPPQTSEFAFWEISDDDLQSLLEWKNLYFGLGL